MKNNSFWRNTAWVLLAVNVFFGLWSQDGLRVLGWGPKVVQEPQREQDQVDVELLTLKPKAP
ncbi:hypothetical protein C5F52_08855 [Limnohabitans sp. TS-CS-82]|jgi:hypothetical protein|uniref:hypothetical protein n=1 Tax=Limnohabitans sp. TS-CS-82 TaxID=2094193 RepID=UPI000CF21498|nr:hypothetical protein [Limnohabitans sp. TS-CS-82]PQA83543.1 hypothetical protein C5F52_08855 [Limnohabitans sp. TS-CS-82]